MLDGNSYYFLRLEGQDTFYAVNAAENPLAVILNAGDQVTIAYTAGEGGGILSGTSVARAGETPVTFTPEEAPADAPAETHLKMQSPSRPRRRLRRGRFLFGASLFVETAVDIPFSSGYTEFHEQKGA